MTAPIPTIIPSTNYFQIPISEEFIMIKKSEYIILRQAYDAVEKNRIRAQQRYDRNKEKNEENYNSGLVPRPKIGRPRKIQ